MNNRKATSIDYETILNIWEKSVIATHDFVKFEDLQEIKTEIPSYLPQLDVRIWFFNDLTIGFSAVSKNHLEMLFLNPDEANKGYGTQILNILIKDFQILSVDVNKDNERAISFYFKHGFIVEDESKTDSSGRPYPILHLKLKENLLNNKK